jgi:hypothetical protein
MPRNPLVGVYAAFVATLGAATRSDAGVVFVERLAVALRAALDAGEPRANDARNMVMLLAHLFIFEVCFFFRRGWFDASRR